MPFIELSEIPKYSIDLFVFTFVIIAYATRSDIIESDDLEDQEALSKKFKWKLNLIMGLFPITSFLLYKCYFGLTTHHNRNGYYFLTGVTGLLIIFGLFLFVCVSQRQMKSVSQELVNKLKLITMMNLITFSIILGCFQGYEWKPRHQVVFLYDNKTIIKSTPHFYYVGATSKYYIMFNEDNNVSSIFSVDKISYMNIIKGHEDYLFKTQRPYPNEKF